MLSLRPRIRKVADAPQVSPIEPIEPIGAPATGAQQSLPTFKPQVTGAPMAAPASTPVPTGAAAPPTAGGGSIGQASMQPAGSELGTLPTDVGENVSQTHVDQVEAEQQQSDPDDWYSDGRSERSRTEEPKPKSEVETPEEPGLIDSSLTWLKNNWDVAAIPIGLALAAIGGKKGRMLGLLAMLGGGAGLYQRYGNFKDNMNMENLGTIGNARLSETTGDLSPELTRMNDTVSKLVTVARTTGSWDTAASVLREHMGDSAASRQITGADIQWLLHQAGYDVGELTPGTNLSGGVRSRLATAAGLPTDTRVLPDE